MLVLRACSSELKSYGGFQWPESGPVSCPDWNPNPECGHGLHGLPWGEGHCSAIDDYLSSENAKWQVVEVDAATVVTLCNNSKCKFPAGTVVFTGDLKGATEYLMANGGYGRAIWGAVITVGQNGVANVGRNGTLTGGECSTLTGGDRSTLTGGDRSTLTGGECSTLTGGDRSTLTGGDRSTLTGGECSTLTGGECSTLTGGECGIIQAKHWDHVAKRWRISTGYIGEDGLLPNTKYRLENGVFIPVEQPVIQSAGQSAAVESTPAVSV